MAETAALNLQVDAFAKRKAEEVLDKLGISMTQAVDMFLYEVALKKDIPFKNDLPMAPPSLNADLMTDEELWEKLKRGVEKAKAGEYESIETVLARHKAKYKD